MKDVVKIDVDAKPGRDLGDLIAAELRTVEVDVRRVDNGIGPCEYWGQRGRDVHWQTEFYGAPTVKVTVWGATDDEPLDEIGSVNTIASTCDERSELALVWLPVTIDGNVITYEAEAR